MATDPDSQSDPAPQDASAPRAEGGSGALHRKVLRGKQERQTRAMSLPKALRLSTAKVANTTLDMAMAVIGARQSRQSGDQLAEFVPADHMLLLFDGTARRAGAAILDPSLVGGLVQQQTMGTVTPHVDGDTRRLTATDAAICAPFLEAVLGRAAKLPEQADERDLLGGYSFGALVEEPRLLLLALNAPEYEVIQLTLDVAAGKRQGALTLLLPTVDAEDAFDDVGDQEAGVPAKPAAQLDRVVLGLDVELRVALQMLTLPLHRVQGFAVGDVLELGVHAFDAASVLTRDGRRLSRGTLGQIDGTRAVQLEHDARAHRGPRRRASDRELLDLPLVSGDGTGTQDRADTAAPALTDMREQVSPSLAPTGPADLPDMSDLPGFDDDAELQAL